jgi:hypothetical protein
VVIRRTSRAGRSENDTVCESTSRSVVVATGEQGDADHRRREQLL